MAGDRWLTFDCYGTLIDWERDDRGRDLLAIVYRRLAEEWGVAASWSDCVAYGRSVRDWPGFDLGTFHWPRISQKLLL